MWIVYVLKVCWRSHEIYCEIESWPVSRSWVAFAWIISPLQSGIYFAICHERLLSLAVACVFYNARHVLWSMIPKSSKNNYPIIGGDASVSAIHKSSRKCIKIFRHSRMHYWCIGPRRVTKQHFLTLKNQFLLSN